MTKRISRVNRLIREELGKILYKEIEFPEGILVTLTRVETTPNLTQAKAYVSIMPENKEEEVLAALKKSLYTLQQKLNKKLKMRPLPRIIFAAEKATQAAGRIEEILEAIKVKDE